MGMKKEKTKQKSSEKNRRIYVIGEMACSHEGNPDLAHKIIKGVGEANADAIQFQIWSLKDLMVPYHSDFDKLSRIELSQGIWTELANYVKEQYPALEIVTCVYEHKSVDLGERMGVDAYKLHSSDLSNPSMLKYVAATGKRIDLSIGASSLDEIQKALELIKAKSDCEIWLMYGYQNFPTPIDAVNLRYMKTLKKLFDLPIGYQDHSDAETQEAFWLPAAAIGLGVDILEKHVTHDRSFNGADHEAALNVGEEFSRFVMMVRNLEKAMGSASPRPFSDEEKRYRKYCKKSIVASRDLPAEIIISQADLIFMRAKELGLPPDESWRLIGKKINRSISKYKLICEDHLK